jgi:hypothetical protein
VDDLAENNNVNKLQWGIKPGLMSKNCEDTNYWLGMFTSESRDLTMSVNGDPEDVDRGLGTVNPISTNACPESQKNSTMIFVPRGVTCIHLHQALHPQNQLKRTAFHRKTWISCWLAMSDMCHGHGQNLGLSILEDGHQSFDGDFRTCFKQFPVVAGMTIPKYTMTMFWSWSHMFF